MLSSLLVSALMVSSAPVSRSFTYGPTIHGDRVVFAAEGDLWLGNVTTQQAYRITTTPGLEASARFSPDGTKVAYTATYDGQTEVYVLPVDGGEPERLTYGTEGAIVQGWSQDGKSVLFGSVRGDNGLGVPRLWSVPAEGGMPKLLPIPRAEFASMGPDGRVAYVPISRDWMNWYGYRAGSNDQIWLADLKGGFSKLSNFAGVDTNPCWLGDEIAFASERTKTANLFKIDPTTKRVTQLTNFVGDHVRYPSSDGSRVVFELGSGLGLYDSQKKEAVRLNFKLLSDQVFTRPQRVSFASVAASPSLGPSGKRILFEARGQIVSLPAKDGDFRVLENKAGARARFPRWSPDGKQYAFVSDRSGEYEIWLADASGAGEAKQLTKGIGVFPNEPVWSPDGKRIAITDRSGSLFLVEVATGGITKVAQHSGMGSYDAEQPNFDFSRDGKWIAYDHLLKNWQSAVYLYEIGTAQKTRISPEGVNCGRPAFTFDGRFVAYVAEASVNGSWSALTYKQYFANPSVVRLVALSNDANSPLMPKNDEEGESKPPAKPEATTKVDLAGIESRWVDFNTPPLTVGQLLAVPGKLLAVALSPSGGPEIRAIDLNTGRSSVAGQGSRLSRNADGSMILIAGDGGFSINESAAPVYQAPPLSLGSASLTINPVAEWRQIFYESWRACRDFFYDPGLHGRDWNAIRAKYEAELPKVGHRTDLTRLTAQMMSELSVGHCYVGGPGFSGPRVPMGFLGADLELVGSAIRVTKIFAGDGFRGSRSPLLEPGVNVRAGDYILEIGGKPVRPDQDPQALLVGAADQVTTLLVNSKPSREGARVVRVRPISSERGLRYVDWVEGRRAYVRKHGGPDLGYVHMADMGSRGMTGFVKGHYSQLDRPGVVYDFRYNGGGNISSLVLQDIAAKPLFYFTDRYRQPWGRESWANPGYKVALCNEDAFSDGELVIESWKKMKIGPVVGKRTGGGEVGSGGGYDLVDGGQIYVPSYGAYEDNRWIIEGVGATPDVEVDQDPAAVLAGRDPQLDKAIELLKASIAKKPIKPMRIPAGKKLP